MFASESKKQFMSNGSNNNAFTPEPKRMYLNVKNLGQSTSNQKNIPRNSSAKAIPQSSRLDRYSYEPENTRTSQTQRSSSARNFLLSLINNKPKKNKTNNDTSKSTCGPITNSITKRISQLNRSEPDLPRALTPKERQI